MQNIIQDENIKTPPSTDARKRAMKKYYLTHKEQILAQHKEFYDNIKNTDDFKQRKQLYNRSFKERQQEIKPKKPVGRPRTYILNIQQETETDNKILKETLDTALIYQDNDAATSATSSESLSYT